MKEEEGLALSCRAGFNGIIYDVIGNVSEMTSDGKQKGGSWDNYPEECTVDKTQSYTLPDPRVGFRVIMEIIEK